MYEGFSFYVYRIRSRILEAYETENWRPDCARKKLYHQRLIISVAFIREQVHKYGFQSDTNTRMYAMGDKFDALGLVNTAVRNVSKALVDRGFMGFILLDSPTAAIHVVQSTTSRH